MTTFQIKEFGERRKKAIFVLAGWHMPLWTTYFSAILFYVKGYHVICYAYEDNIFSPDVPRTLSDITEVKLDILERIAVLKREGCSDFSIYAMSFGTILALLVANESNDVTSVVLNTTSADPAFTAWSWNGRFQPDFKKRLVAQGYTLESLQKAWEPITPLHHMNNMAGKRFLIYLTEKDRIVPYVTGLELMHELNKRGYFYKLVVNRRLNHLQACIYNLLRPHIYLKFLQYKD